MPTAAIEVTGLIKKYGDFTAVDDFTFKVRSGEICGLLGSNGAGKTTTLYVLTGLLRPTHGTATICGFDVVKEPLEVKKRIGYLPEMPALYERLSGEEMLKLIGRLRGIDEAMLTIKIERLADMLELGDQIYTRIGAYSKGMKQKVSFASALLHNPEILLLDEPTSGLDPRFGKLVKDLILKARGEGSSVLMCTHLTTMAEELCDKVIIIHRGKNIVRGTVEEVLKKTGTKSLEDAFVESVGGKIEVGAGI